MADLISAGTERLWREYGAVFKEFDDLTLGRWLSQTLGIMVGRGWRFSHPLMGAYRLAAQLGYDRQIWHKRLATPPLAYVEAGCCRAPLLPLVTRDVLQSGLVCLHCAGTAVPLEDLPTELQEALKTWAEGYAAVHAVAHWDEAQQAAVADYDEAFEEAAHQAEKLLVAMGDGIIPRLLEIYPAVVWEDQDECLEVNSEDLILGAAQK